MYVYTYMYIVTVGKSCIMHPQVPPGHQVGLIPNIPADRGRPQGLGSWDMSDRNSNTVQVFILGCVWKWHLPQVPTIGGKMVINHKFWDILGQIPPIKQTTRHDPFRAEMPPIVSPGDRQKDGNHREKASGAHAARADPAPQFLLGFYHGKAVRSWFRQWHGAEKKIWSQTGSHWRYCEIFLEITFI